MAEEFGSLFGFVGSGGQEEIWDVESVVNFCFATAERRARVKKILVFISSEFMLFGVWFAGKVRKILFSEDEASKGK